MRTKRRPAGLWVTCMFALMPPVYIRCSVPDEPPPPAERSAERAVAERPTPLDELRSLMVEHAELGPRAVDHEGRPFAERAHYEAAGRALGRLREAARAATGPCAAQGATAAEVASLDALATSLGDELDRHLASPEKGESEPADEEARHTIKALGLIDELDRAYDDVERGARRRAIAGCLGQGDV